jgi:hypothetical protein
VNDYSTGGNDAKTACMFALLADINANAGVPYNRLAVGFQTHVTAAQNQFPSKAALATNFQKLAALGANAMVTEIDIKISGTSSANERFQAAIWGDYLDVRTRGLHQCPSAANLNPSAGLPLRVELLRVRQLEPARRHVVARRLGRRHPLRHQWCAYPARTPARRVDLCGAQVTRSRPRTRSPRA